MKQDVYHLPKVGEMLSNLTKGRVYLKLDANLGFWQVKLNPRCSYHEGKGHRMFQYPKVRRGAKTSSRHAATASSTSGAEESTTSGTKCGTEAVSMGDDSLGVKRPSAWSAAGPSFASTVSGVPQEHFCGERLSELLRRLGVKGLFLLPNFEKVLSELEEREKAFEEKLLKPGCGLQWREAGCFVIAQRPRS